MAFSRYDAVPSSLKFEGLAQSALVSEGTQQPLCTHSYAADKAASNDSSRCKARHFSAKQGTWARETRPFRRICMTSAGEDRALLGSQGSWAGRSEGGSHGSVGLSAS